MVLMAIFMHHAQSWKFIILLLQYLQYKKQQDKIFRRKRLGTDANFVNVYIEIWDNGYTKV